MHTQNNIEQCWRRCLRLRANKSSCGILCVPSLFFHQSGLRNSTEIYKLMFPRDETASQLVAYSPQPSKPTKSHCCRQGKRRCVPNMKHRMQNTNTNSTPEQTLKRFTIFFSVTNKQVNSWHIPHHNKKQAPRHFVADNGRGKDGVCIKL